MRTIRTRPLLALLMLVLPAGCMSSDPGAPNYNPSLTAINETLSPTAPQPAAPFVEAGARRSDAFPTFARMPQGATAQMTDAEREMMRAEMAALAAEQRNDTTTAAEYRARLAELRRIARTHGAERLERIEN